MDKRKNLQKSSNGKNVTLISTVIKRLAAKSLRLEIKITKRLKPGNSIPKNQTLESSSLKILAKETLFQSFVDKKSEGKKYYIKNIHQKVREQTKNHAKNESDCHSKV